MLVARGKNENVWVCVCKLTCKQNLGAQTWLVTHLHYYIDISIKMEYH